jgi:hypothetical protein
VRGFRYEGGRITVTRHEIAPNDGRNGAEEAVDVTVAQTVLRVYDGKRLVDRASPTKGVTFRLWLDWVGEWRVVQKGRVI